MYLEKVLSNVEMGLSYGAAIPFLGTIPAALKVGLGCVQVVTAIAASILLAPAAFTKKGRALCLRSIKHVAHGFGNIVGGILEAIPFVGTAMAGIRYFKSKNLGCCSTNKNLSTRQDKKFMAYREVINNDAHYYEDDLNGREVTGKEALNKGGTTFNCTLLTV